jgi:DNA-binding transcriptional ArsR family regulator
MDEKVFNYIREQIDYLKADLEREVPLNMDSEFQPEAAAKIHAMRDETRRRILDLLDRLAGGEPGRDDKKCYREMLERLAGDRASVDAAKEAVCEMDDDDCKTELMRDVCALYESSKKEIAAKLIEKLG